MTTTPINDTSIASGFNVDELTEGSLTGKGVLDVLLQTLRLHLDREFTSGRITGTAYATVYAQAITAFLAQAAQYALSKAKLPLELQLLEEQITLAQKQQDQITADTSLKDYELTDIKPTQKAQIVAETSHVTKQELNTVQQTLNLGSQQAQIETETDRILYEITNKLPEEVQLIKLNQDQLIAQNNKIATDTVVTIKQGHLTDAQTCQVTAQTNQVNAEVALKLPEEVELVKRNQASVTAQIAQATAQTAQTTAQTAQVTYTTANLIPAQVAGETAKTAQVTYTTANLLPKQVLLAQAQTDNADAQVAQVTAQTAQVTYTTANLLPAQVTNTTAQTANTTAQTDLYAQKKVTELAQTTNTPAATSVMGVQNALMEQQRLQYLRDAEQKAAKIMIETWAVRQNTDGGQIITANHLGDSYIATAVDALLAGI